MNTPLREILTALPILASAAEYLSDTEARPPDGAGQTELRRFYREALRGSFVSDGRSLSDLVSGTNRGHPVEDPTGRGTKGWRLRREAVPDEVILRRIRIDKLTRKFGNRALDLGLIAHPVWRCNIWIDQYGIKCSGAIRDGFDLDLKGLNDKQKNFLLGEGHNIALKLFSLRMEEYEDERATVRRRP
jgi:hypothetical protein